jgi:hypothetical protein
MTTEPRGSRRPWRAVAGLSGAFMVLGALGWAIARRAFEPGAFGLGFFGVVLYVAGLWRVSFRSVLHFVNVGLYVAFAFGIAVVVYFFFRRHDARLDLTPHKAHTLSDQTLRYLDALKKEVAVTVFDMEARPYSGLLDRFAEATPHIRWAIYDPTRDPEFTRQFDPIVPNGMVYVVHGERSKRLNRDRLDEGALANAIVEVTRERKIAIYFLSDHGELAFDLPRSPTGEARPIPSVSAMRDYLQTQALTVKPLSLSDSHGVIPEDAALLVIAGPTQDIFPGERRAIEEYLNEGGKLLVYFDLPISVGASVDFTQLAGVLRSRGLDDRERVIFDEQGERREGSRVNIRVASYNPSHPITEPLQRSSSRLVMPFVRGLTPVEPPVRGYQIWPLLATGNGATLEPFAGRPPGAEKPTPRQHALAWAVEGGPPPGRTIGTRIVVFGGSLLVQNNYLGSNLTAQHLMDNTVKWLTEQEDLIAAPPMRVRETPLPLSPAEIWLTGAIVALALPTLLLLGGVSYSLIARRR